MRQCSTCMPRPLQHVARHPFTARLCARPSSSRFSCSGIAQSQQKPRAEAHASKALPTSKLVTKRPTTIPFELVAGDAEKEQSRQYRRTTFDHERWAMHRSTSRYWRHVRSMLRSRIVKGLAAPLLYVGVVASVVCCYESLLKDGVLPDWGFTWPSLSFQATGVYSLSTFALSLLLVFRTNGSYQRWNEARKLWGLTTNRCRDLSRQVTQWLVDPSDAALVSALCRHIKAFPLALMNSLRYDHDLDKDLSSVLEPQEKQLLMQQPHIGTAVLQAMGAMVAASNAKELHKLRIDENITLLQDTMGGCERIFRTPIPLSYTRHTSRFLVCWLTLLPFCTANSVGWLTVPIACAVAFFLLGIEEIGVQAEEPFGILALEVFCETIMRNVQQAEDAAAAMHTMAASRAAGYSAQASHSNGVQRSSTSLLTSSTSSSTGRSSVPVTLQLLPPVSVAGQEVPAAEQAYSVSAEALLPGDSIDCDAEGPIGPITGKASAEYNQGSRQLQATVRTSAFTTTDQGSAPQVGESQASGDLEIAAFWQSSVSTGVSSEDGDEFTV